MSALFQTVKTQHPIIFWASCAEIVGSLFNLIGQAILSSDAISTNVGWYYLFYYIIVGSLIITAITYDSLDKYKTLLLILVTLSLAYLPEDINTAIVASQAGAAANAAVAQANAAAAAAAASFPGQQAVYYTSSYNSYAAGAGLKSTGLIIIILSFFAVLYDFTVGLETPAEASTEKEVDPTIVTVTNA